MNINSTSSTGAPQQPLPPTTKPTPGQKQELRKAFKEEFQPEQFKALSEAWAANPEVRSEVLSTAKQLATDPNYPTPAQLSQLAHMVLGDSAPVPPSVQPPVTEPPVTEPPVQIEA